MVYGLMAILAVIVFYMVYKVGNLNKTFTSELSKRDQRITILEVDLQRQVRTNRLILARLEAMSLRIQRMEYILRNANVGRVTPARFTVNPTERRSS